MVYSTSGDQVVQALRQQIENMAAGEQLASTRSLVAEMAVSPVTVSRALAALAAEGLVITRPGSGSYVADRPPRPSPPRDLSWQSMALGARTIDASSMEFLLEAVPPGAIPLGSGYPHPSLLPNRALASALARASRRPDVSDRPPPLGLSALRTWFARSVGPAISAADVLVTSGAQASLSAAFRAIAPPGSPVLMESPTYIGAITVARAAGLRPVPVPIDDDGVQPARLAEAFGTTGARLFYCQPTFQNPTGAVLARHRRREVLEVAATAGAFVVEDDYARALNHDKPAPPALVVDDQDGRVVYISSLTKPVSPNLRVGAIVARGPVGQRISALRLVDDFFVPRMLQEAALELVSAPAWGTHLARLGASLAERRQALLGALSHHLPESPPPKTPRGGLHVWLPLADRTDEVDLAGRARAAGVLVSPGRPYYPAEPPAPFLRLSFAAVADVGELDQGVQRLARVMKKRGGCY
ncbi:MAG: PLP-dependent aminotransferase family protein [Acidimicrobiales bacterium]